MWTERIRDAVQDGTVLDLAPGVSDGDLLRSEPSGWPSEREIPAEAVRRVLHDSAIKYDLRGLRLRGARVTDALDLSHVAVAYPLWFGYCAFDGAVAMDGFHGVVLGLPGARASTICLARAQIDGDLVLRDAILSYGDGVALDLHGATVGGLSAERLVTTGGVHATQASIKGDLVLQDATLCNAGGAALNLKGASVGGDLSAGRLTTTGEVSALGASITGDLTLDDARLTNAGGSALSLDGATVGGTLRVTPSCAGRQATCDGGIRAIGADFKGDLVLESAGLRNESGPALDLTAAKVGGSLFAEGLATTGQVAAVDANFTGAVLLGGATLTDGRGGALCLDGATVGGTVYAEKLKATCGVFENDFTAAVSASQATLKGQLRLGDATLTNEGGIALYLQGTTIGGNLSAERLTTTGEIYALGASVGGDLVLEDVTLTNKSGSAVSLDGATIGGALKLLATRDDRKARCAGGVRAPQATIKGSLVLDGANLCNESGPALDLSGARVGGDLSAQGLEATGQVAAIDANITGAVLLGGAKLTNTSGSALSLDGATVSGTVYAEKLTATGGLNDTDFTVAMGASQATFKAQLRLGDATLNNEGGVALYLQGTTIGGNLSAERLTTTGEIYALGASVGGDLVLEDVTLTNKSGSAVSLDGATVAGALRLSATSDDRVVECAGGIRAPRATIKGQFKVKDAILSNKGKSALDLAGATVGADLFLQPARVDGDLDLTMASLGRLTVSDGDPGGQRDPADTAVFGSNLKATGWHLGDINGWLRTDRQAAQDWLDHGANGSPFAAQPWQELARVYEQDGQLADAKRIRYEAARRMSSRGPLPSRCLGFLYNLFAGHGYYPLIAAAWLAAALLLSFALISIFQGSFIPTTPTSAVQSGRHPAVTADQITGATSCEDLSSTYPCFEPTLYAAESILPAAIDTGVAASWQPATTHAHSVSFLLPLALNVLKIFAWIMAALLLAGVTGLLHQT